MVEPNRWAHLLGTARPAVALASMVIHFVSGLALGGHLLPLAGAGELWSLWLLLSPIWLMAAVFGTVAALDRARYALTGDDRARGLLDTRLGDVHLGAGIALGGVAMCVAAWALSAALIYPMLGLAVAVVVGTLWEAMPGG